MPVTAAAMRSGFSAFNAWQRSSCQVVAALTSAMGNALTYFQTKSSPAAPAAAHTSAMAMSSANDAAR
ncbi:hypothetical protein D9M72_156290 [compost metagenome]